MLKRIWIWILTNVFKVKTETKTVEVEEIQKFAHDYERIDGINLINVEKRQEIYFNGIWLWWSIYSALCKKKQDLL